MAFIDCHFFSETLGLSTSMYVILPQKTKQQIGLSGAAGNGKHPALYLLHGLSDDHTIWLRRTSIDRYVAPLGLAVVMPAAQRSFYTDMAHGLRYWTFVSEELPALAREFFPLSGAREDNFVAGLSMGGYGAFKLALRCPDRFAAAASLSGAVDIANTAQNVEEAKRVEWANIFGDLKALPGSENDLMHLAARVARSEGPKPALYAWCGTEDFLYQGNLRFRDHARAIGLPLTYEEGPGAHQWAFWDEKIQRVLEWLPLRRM
ncbi:MAG: alpha/beta hydrolase family protein [Candidatus Sumerlaeota bacterium]|nr:alpha/beta hydrolase family protein [Candidatus Sumerlaeota bacterium]